MFKKTLLILLLISALVVASCGPQPTPEAEEPVGEEEEVEEAEDTGKEEEKVTLVIESWRNDDKPIWDDVLIPAFNEHYPNIEVIFSPTIPADYNAALNAKLEGGTAGDIITCRPFDLSLGLYKQGHLASVKDLPGMEHFGDVARSAWITDDGSDVFCVPMGAVIQGFIYNKDIFDELGLSEPETVPEFYDVLDAIKEDGQYTPIAMGVADEWPAGLMGFDTIGESYWHGEEGRLGLINGTKKFTDPEFVRAFEEIAKWKEYMAPGAEAMTYPDSQNMFTLGQAAIFPAGSWEIPIFEAQADFEMGAFKPPLPEGEDTCYVVDHVDIAMGMNANAKHPEEAKLFLQWLTTQEFAQLYTSNLSGFFSLSDHPVTVDDPLAADFLSWRDECETGIRLAYQILSRGDPNLDLEIWRVSTLVINGEMTPEEAAAELQAGLESWYEPQQ